MKTIKYKTIRGLLSQSGQMTIEYFFRNMFYHMSKRKDKGLPIDRDYLANCSMMINITLAAKRAEEGNITKEEREKGGYQIADYILEKLIK